MNSHKTFKAFIAGFTTFVFTVTSFGISPNVFAAAAMPEVSLPYQAALDRSLNLAVPQKFGKLEHFNAGQNDKPAIFHVQMAHGHYEAQQQIREILHYLDAQYGVKTVLVEGSAFKLEPELLNFFPENPALTLKVNDALTKKSIVKGPELYLLESKGSKAYGIEELEAYRENGVAFVNVLEEKQKTEQFLADMDLQIDRLASRLLNKDLRDFLRRLDAFEKNQIPFDAWLGQLKGEAAKRLEIDLASPAHQLDWPMMVRLFKVQELTAKLDRKKFPKEREEFLKTIGRFFPRSTPGAQHATKKQNLLTVDRGVLTAIEELLRSDSMSVQLPDPETGMLFEDLAKRLPENFNYEAFPNVRNFIATLLLQSELKAGLMMSEVRRLSAAITEKHIRNKNEKKLTALLADHRLLQKLFALELTPENYEQILQRKGQRATDNENFIKPSHITKRFEDVARYASGATRGKDVLFSNIGELDQLFDRAMQFYQGVKERDTLMMRRIEERLKETGDSKVVVITGGFHSEPFHRYFADKKYTYALISPRISGADKEGYAAYLDNVMSITKHSTRETVSPMDREVLAPENLYGIDQGAMRNVVRTVIQNITGFKNYKDYENKLKFAAGLATAGGDLRSETRQAALGAVQGPSGLAAITFTEAQDIVEARKAKARVQGTRGAWPSLDSVFRDSSFVFIPIMIGSGLFRNYFLYSRSELRNQAKGMASDEGAETVREAEHVIQDRPLHERRVQGQDAADEEYWRSHGQEEFFAGIDRDLKGRSEARVDPKELETKFPTAAELGIRRPSKWMFWVQDPVIERMKTYTTEYLAAYGYAPKNMSWLKSLVETYLAGNQHTFKAFQRLLPPDKLDAFVYIGDLKTLPSVEKTPAKVEVQSALKTPAQPTAKKPAAKRSEVRLADAQEKPMRAAQLEAEITQVKKKLEGVFTVGSAPGAFELAKALEELEGKLELLSEPNAGRIKEVKKRIAAITKQLNEIFSMDAVPDTKPLAAELKALEDELASLTAKRPESHLTSELVPVDAVPFEGSNLIREVKFRFGEKFVTLSAPYFSEAKEKILFYDIKTGDNNSGVAGKIAVHLDLAGNLVHWNPLTTNQRSRSRQPDVWDAVTRFLKQHKYKEWTAGKFRAKAGPGEEDLSNPVDASVTLALEPLTPGAELRASSFKVEEVSAAYRKAARDLRKLERLLPAKDPVVEDVSLARAEFEAGHLTLDMLRSRLLELNFTRFGDEVRELAEMIVKDTGGAYMDFGAEAYENIRRPKDNTDKTVTNNYDQFVRERIPVRWLESLRNDPNAYIEIYPGQIALTASEVSSRWGAFSPLQVPLHPGGDVSMSDHTRLKIEILQEAREAGQTRLIVTNLPGSSTFSQLLAFLRFAEVPHHKILIHRGPSEEQIYAGFENQDTGIEGKTLGQLVMEVDAMVFTPVHGVKPVESILKGDDGFSRSIGDENPRGFPYGMYAENAGPSNMAYGKLIETKGKKVIVFNTRSIFGQTAEEFMDWLASKRPSKLRQIFFLGTAGGIRDPQKEPETDKIGFNTVVIPNQVGLDVLEHPTYQPEGFENSATEWVSLLEKSEGEAAGQVKMGTATDPLKHITAVNVGNENASSAYFWGTRGAKSVDMELYYLAKGVEALRKADLSVQFYAALRIFDVLNSPGENNDETLKKLTDPAVKKATEVVDANITKAIRSSLTNARSELRGGFVEASDAVLNSAKELIGDPKVIDAASIRSRELAAQVSPAAFGEAQEILTAPVGQFAARLPETDAMLRKAFPFIAGMDSKLRYGGATTIWSHSRRIAEMSDALAGNDPEAFYADFEGISFKGERLSPSVWEAYGKLGQDAFSDPENRLALRLAKLFHDIGILVQMPAHEPVGALVLKDILDRLPVSDKVKLLVLWSVGNHLNLGVMGMGERTPKYALDRMDPLPESLRPVANAILVLLQAGEVRSLVELKDNGKLFNGRSGEFYINVADPAKFDTLKAHYDEYRLKMFSSNGDWILNPVKHAEAMLLINEEMPRAQREQFWRYMQDVNEWTDYGVYIAQEMSAKSLVMTHYLLSQLALVEGNKIRNFRWTTPRGDAKAAALGIENFLNENQVSFADLTLMGKSPAQIEQIKAKFKASVSNDRKHIRFDSNAFKMAPRSEAREGLRESKDAVKAELKRILKKSEDVSALTRADMFYVVRHLVFRDTTEGDDLGGYDSNLMSYYSVNITVERNEDAFEILHRAISRPDLFSKTLWDLWDLVRGLGFISSYDHLDPSTSYIPDPRAFQEAEDAVLQIRDEVESIFKQAKMSPREVGEKEDLTRRRILADLEGLDRLINDLKKDLTAPNRVQRLRALNKAYRTLEEELQRLGLEKEIKRFWSPEIVEFFYKAGAVAPLVIGRALVLGAVMHEVLKQEKASRAETRADRVDEQIVEHLMTKAVDDAHLLAGALQSKRTLNSLGQEYYDVAEQIRETLAAEDIAGVEADRFYEEHRGAIVSALLARAEGRIESRTELRTVVRAVMLAAVIGVSGCVSSGTGTYRPSTYRFPAIPAYKAPVPKIPKFKRPMAIPPQGIRIMPKPRSELRTGVQLDEAEVDAATLAKIEERWKKIRYMETDPEGVKLKVEAETKGKDFLGNAQATIRKVAAQIRLDPGVLEELLKFTKEIRVKIPLQLDEGGPTYMIDGYRIGHAPFRGPYKGGIRYAIGVVENMIKALATEMSVKNAIAGLPYGGGKGGVAINPKELSVKELARLTRGYVAECLKQDPNAFGPLSDVPAGDIGTTSREMGWFADEFLKIMRPDLFYTSPDFLEKLAKSDETGTPFLEYYMQQYYGKRHIDMSEGSPIATVTAKPEGKGGAMGRTPATGLGLYYVTREALKVYGERLGIGASVKGQKVAVEAYGNVGGHAVRSFRKDGAAIMSIKEYVGGQNVAIAAVKDSGIDLDALDRHLAEKNADGTSKKNTVLTYAAAHPEDARIVTVDQFWSSDVTIMILAAKEKTVNKDIAALIKAKIISEGANGPLELDGSEQILLDKGAIILPDVATNDGGVAFSSMEWRQNNIGELWPEVAGNGLMEDKVVSAFYDISRVSESQKITLREAAYQIAISKIVDAMLAEDSELGKLFDEAHPPYVMDAGAKRWRPETLPELQQIDSRAKKTGLIEKADAAMNKKIDELVTEALQTLPAKRGSVILLGGPRAAGKPMLATQIMKKIRAQGIKAAMLDMDYQTIEDISRALQGKTIFVRQENGLSGGAFNLEDKEILVVHGYYALSDEIIRFIKAMGGKVYPVMTYSSPDILLANNWALTAYDLRLMRDILTSVAVGEEKNTQEVIRRWQWQRVSESEAVFATWKNAKRAINTYLPYELPFLKSLIAPMVRVAIQQEKSSRNSDVFTLNVLNHLDKLLAGVEGWDISLLDGHHDSVLWEYVQRYVPNGVSAESADNNIGKVANTLIKESADKIFLLTSLQDAEDLTQLPSWISASIERILIALEVQEDATRWYAQNRENLVRHLSARSEAREVPSLGPTHPELEAKYKEQVEASTPAYVKRGNPVFDITNPGQFEAVLKHAHLYAYKEGVAFDPANPGPNDEGLGLMAWLEDYEAEAKVATAGIRLTQNILYPWDTRNRINEIGIAFATLAKAFVSKEQFSGKDLEKLTGGESRYNTKRFVDMIARIQAAQGIRTYVPVKRHTTPIWMVSMLAFKFDLVGAEHVTSSHAGSNFSATKDINNQGSQYLPEESGRFVAKIRDMFETAKKQGEFRFTIAAANDPRIDEDLMKATDDGTDVYVEYLKNGVATGVNLDRIRNVKDKIIIDSVGGSMYRTMTRIFAKLGIADAFQWFHTGEDPFFHGIGKELTSAGKVNDYTQDTTVIKRDKKTGETTSIPVMERMGYDSLLKDAPIGKVVLMTDPDGDRLVTGQVESVARAAYLKKLGVEVLKLDENRILAVYSPNQSFFMSMVYHADSLKAAGLWDKHPRFIIMTTASSPAWREWAEKNGVQVLNVPVGFKEIAAMMKKVEYQMKKSPGKPVIVKDVFGREVNLGMDPRMLFAGEESGGMIIGPEEPIRSRSGRLAIAMREKSAGEALVIQAAMAAYLESKGQTLSGYLNELFDRNRIASRFDVRHDQTFYNQSEPDPDELKKEKAKGEIAREKNYAFFVNMVLSKLAGKTTVPQIIEILNGAFAAQNLRFDDLQDMIFVGDGVYLQFPDKIMEIRPSGTDAKSKSYGYGNDKLRLAVYAQAVGAYSGEPTDLYRQYVDMSNFDEVRVVNGKPVFRGEDVRWELYQAYYREGLPEEDYQPATVRVGSNFATPAQAEILTARSELRMNADALAFRISRDLVKNVSADTDLLLSALQGRKTLASMEQDYFDVAEQILETIDRETGWGREDAEAFFEENRDAILRAVLRGDANEMDQRSDAFKKFISRAETRFNLSAGQVSVIIKSSLVLTLGLVVWGYLPVMFKLAWGLGALVLAGSVLSVWRYHRQQENLVRQFPRATRLILDKLQEQLTKREAFSKWDILAEVQWAKVNQRLVELSTLDALIAHGSPHMLQDKDLKLVPAPQGYVLVKRAHSTLRYDVQLAPHAEQPKLRSEMREVGELQNALANAQTQKEDLLKQYRKTRTADLDDQIRRVTNRIAAYQEAVAKIVINNEILPSKVRQAQVVAGRISLKDENELFAQALRTYWAIVPLADFQKTDPVAALRFFYGLAPSKTDENQKYMQVYKALLTGDQAGAQAANRKIFGMPIRDLSMASEIFGEKFSTYITILFALPDHVFDPQYGILGNQKIDSRLLKSVHFLQHITDFQMVDQTEALTEEAKRLFSSWNAWVNPPRTIPVTPVLRQVGGLRVVSSVGVSAQSPFPFERLQREVPALYLAANHVIETLKAVDARPRLVDATNRTINGVNVQEVAIQTNHSDGKNLKITLAKRPGQDRTRYSNSGQLPPEVDFEIWAEWDNGSEIKWLALGAANEARHAEGRDLLIESSALLAQLRQLRAFPFLADVFLDKRAGEQGSRSELRLGAETSTYFCLTPEKWIAFGKQITEGPVEANMRSRGDHEILPIGQERLRLALAVSARDPEEWTALGKLISGDSIAAEALDKRDREILSAVEERLRLALAASAGNPEEWTALGKQMVVGPTAGNTQNRKDQDIVLHVAKRLWPTLGDGVRTPDEWTAFGKRIAVDSKAGERQNREDQEIMPIDVHYDEAVVEKVTRWFRAGILPLRVALSVTHQKALALLDRLGIRKADAVKLASRLTADDVQLLEAINARSLALSKDQTGKNLVVGAVFMDAEGLLGFAKSDSRGFYAMLEELAAEQAVNGSTAKPILTAGNADVIQGIVQALNNKSSALLPAEKSKVRGLLDQVLQVEALKGDQAATINALAGARSGGMVTVLSSADMLAGLHEGANYAFKDRLAKENVKLVVRALLGQMRTLALQLDGASAADRVKLLEEFNARRMGGLKKTQGGFVFDNVLLLVQSFLAQEKATARSA